MNKCFEKIKFYLRRPKVIVVAGAAQKTAKEAISAVLRPYFKIGKEVLVFESTSRDAKELAFFLRKSSFPILVVSHLGEYHPEKEFFAGELRDAEDVIKLAQSLPAHGHLVLNYDDETVRDIHNQSLAHPLTFYHTQAYLTPYHK